MQDVVQESIDDEREGRDSRGDVCEVIVQMNAHFSDAKSTSTGH